MSENNDRSGHLEGSAGALQNRPGLQVQLVDDQAIGEAERDVDDLTSGLKRLGRPSNCGRGAPTSCRRCTGCG